MRDDVIRNYKDYWLGLLGSSFTGSIILALHPGGTDFPLVIEILLGTTTLFVLAFLLAIPILAISWIFIRNGTFLRLIQFAVIVSVIMTLVYILSFLLQLQRS